jgi:predicted DNA-binding WGR domain protein
MKRHFVFVSDTSNKFWEVEQSGCEMTVRYGRIGATGQTKTKPFDSEADAMREALALVKKKLAEGYVEQAVDAPAEAAGSAPAPPKSDATKSTKPSSRSKATRSASPGVSRPQALVFTARGWPLGESILRALPLSPAILDRPWYFCAKGGPSRSIYDTTPEPPYLGDEARWGRIGKLFAAAILGNPEVSGLGPAGGQPYGSHNSASLDELTRSLESDGYEVTNLADALARHTNAALLAAKKAEAKRRAKLLSRLTGLDGGVWASHAKNVIHARVIARIAAWLDQGGTFPTLDDADPREHRKIARLSTHGRTGLGYRGVDRSGRASPRAQRAPGQARPHLSGPRS